MRVGHGEAEELAARPQPRLARDEATHPVLRRVLVGADQRRRAPGRRGRPAANGAGVARAQAPQRDPVALEALRDRERRHARASIRLSAWYVRRPMRRCRVALVVLAAGCGGGRARTPTSRRASSRSRSSARRSRARQHIAQTRAAARARAQRRPADAANVAVTVETTPTAAAQRGDRVRPAPARRRTSPRRRGRSGCSTTARAGGDTAYVNTWLGGRAAGPGETTRADLEARRLASAGRYTIDYRVSPGLTGRASAAGGRNRGRFDVHDRRRARPRPRGRGRQGRARRRPARRRLRSRLAKSG